MAKSKKASPGNPQEFQLPDVLQAFETQLAIITDTLEQREKNHKAADKEDARRLAVLEKEAKADDEADARRDQQIGNLGQQIGMLSQRIDAKQDKTDAPDEDRIKAIWTRLQKNSARLQTLATAEAARAKPFSDGKS